MNRDYSFPLRVAADKFPGRVAFVCAGRRWTFAEFDEAADRLAAAFTRRGLTGRTVVLLLQNEPYSILTYFALARAGAVAVPVNPRLHDHEISFILDDCGAKAIVADGAFVEAAERIRAGRTEAVDLFTIGAGDTGAAVESVAEEPAADTAPVVVDADAPATIFYTSGTSGFPKGVVRTHDANLWTCVNSLAGQARTVDDVEVFLLPVFGIAFVFQVLPMVLAGGTVVLDGGFDPARTWELLEEHQATRVFLAPTMLDSLLAVAGHEQRDLSALRVLNTAYEFPERIRLAAEQRFGPVLAYMYGLTEAQLCVSTPAEFAADPTNAGHAMGMMRVRVLDAERRPLPPGEVGEIAFQGPSVMSEYHDRAEATAEALVDGWLLTGDLGYLDDHGRIHVSGRKKEIIKTGGFTVDPVEVENVLLKVPGVREAAVIGVPDEHWGQRTVALVVANGTVTADGLRAFVKANIASFKAPKQVLFIEELPRTPTGKIQRGQLRSLVATMGH